MELSWATVAMQEFLVSGISVGIATTLTNPIDVVKTRLQLQRLKTVGGEAPPGMVGTGVALVRTEGPLSLWAGLPPALARGFFYGGARLGLYNPIKAAIGNLGSGSTDGTQLSIWGKLAAGSLSGALAAGITNPTELVKTRLQDKNNTHKGSVAVVRHILETEGVGGLWRGAMPGMTRAAIVTACQCGTYDEIKRTLLRYTSMQDGLLCHFSSSLTAGLIATTATNPIDVVKTVVFAGGNSSGGPVAAAANIMRSDGPRGFFKGWSANFARLGPQTVITFLVCEAMRDALGMKAL